MSSRPTTKRLALLLILLPCAPATALAQWPVDGRALCTASGDQVTPVIASDGTGGAIVAWEDRRDPSGNSRVYVRRVLASGVADPAWPSDGLPISITPNSQKRPVIVSDRSGGAIVCWDDSRDDLYGDIYAQHVLASGVIDPAWPTVGVAVCVAANAQQSPSIASDGLGGAIIAWHDKRNGSHLDIYAHHVLAAGSVDPAWPSSGKALTSAVGGQLFVKIVPDGAGGAVAAWEDNRTGSADIYAQRILATGSLAPGWPTNGSLLCSATSTQRNVALVADGSHGAIVAWMDFRSGAYFDIYAQRVLESGVVAPGWPVSGKALCTAPLSQIEPVIVSDDSGGAVVAWQDDGRGIYAQRVDGSGAALWAPDGAAVFGGGGRPTIAPDGTGGALVAWSDGRGPYPAIYAQHMQWYGLPDPIWPPEGRAVCTAATYDNVVPLITPDGYGGGIVAWSDRRGLSNWDVYAQRVVHGSGVANTGGVPAGGVRDPALSTPWPNPAFDATSVRFTLPAAGRVRLAVYDAAGRQVRILTVGTLSRGAHVARWDARDDAGRNVPDGVFFIRLEAEGARGVSRVVVMRSANR